MNNVYGGEKKLLLFLSVFFVVALKEEDVGGVR
jgi:hypothetical protein